ncbi:MAG: FAD-dependent oxidoreductase [Polyangiaceae bacterium]|nr:FAD-dependent oxidoreductase [Polyangiaceae bacterium]
MAKTPLMRALRSLFSDMRAARAHNLSLSGLREERAVRAEKVRGVGRRDVLFGAAAGAAALALPRSAKAANNAEVAIVGGGIAGLACALALKDKNVSSTVYEASNRIGGRMFTNFDYFGGQVAEWGGELVDSGHKSIIALCKRFNLPLTPLSPPSRPGLKIPTSFLEVITHALRLKSTLNRCTTPFPPMLTMRRFPPFITTLPPRVKRSTR